MAAYTLVEVPESSALVRRAVCAHADLGPTIGRLFGEIVAGNPDADLEDAPRIYYREWTADRCEIEAALPVSPSVGPAEGTTIKAYAACVAATRDHVGSYESLHEAWLQFYAVAREEGLQPNGYPWDEYVVGPNEDPNPANWVTALYLPLG